MLGASCSKEEVKSLTLPRLCMCVISVCYFYFSPVIDQQIIVIFNTYSSFDSTVGPKENFRLERI